jgi:hypothetical protein
MVVRLHFVLQFVDILLQLLDLFFQSFDALVIVGVIVSLFVDHSFTSLSGR